MRGYSVGAAESTVGTDGDRILRFAGHTVASTGGYRSCTRGNENMEDGWVAMHAKRQKYEYKWDNTDTKVFIK